MNRDDFLFDLPQNLIAQQPLADRTASRLLTLKPDNRLSDGFFSQLINEINDNDLIIFNNTKVIPARLFGQKASGGKIEVLVERLLSDTTCLAHIKANHAPKPDAILTMEGGFECQVIERQNSLFHLKALGDKNLLELLEANGHIPLPPYIERGDDDEDKERYQTVYAKEPGAVAAPTAGLHFDEDLLNALQAKGTELAYVTLHVGAGTFQPVRENDLSKHIMHKEYVEVSQAVVDAIHACKQRGGRVIAVGTTTLRSLEAASLEGQVKPFSGLTDIFIMPGYTFNCVDVLITNFHLPGSTLLMLVSAFSGYEAIMQAYQHAIAEQYRFFSYGDAMLLFRNS